MIEPGEIVAAAAKQGFNAGLIVGLVSGFIVGWVVMKLLY